MLLPGIISYLEVYQVPRSVYHTSGRDAFAGAVTGGGGEGESAGTEGCEGCEGGELVIVTMEPAPDTTSASAPTGIDSCKTFSQQR